MIRVPNPQTKIWQQTNKSDVLGSLRGSFNLDLTLNLGKTRTTGMLQTTFQATNSDFTAPAVGYRYYLGKIWTVAGSKVHSNSGTPKDPFTVDASTGTPTTCDSLYSDIEVSGDTTGSVLYVTTASNSVYYTTNGTLWSNFTAGAGDTTNPHMLLYYAGRMYMTTVGNKIISWDSSRTVATTGQYTLTLPPSQYITWMRSSSNRIWIGTINQNNGKGYVYEWDGSSSNPTKSYRMEGQGALACVIKDDVPYVMDSNGKIFYWNGGTFKEAARLPLNEKYLTRPLEIGGSGAGNGRFIHPNGMTILNGRILCLINNKISDNAGSTLEFCPSGIWELDFDSQNPAGGIGLYHKYSLSYTPVGSTTITDWGQNRLSQVGALSDMKLVDTSAGANGSLLASATIFTDASSTTNGVFINDTKDTRQKTAYFVTTELDGVPTQQEIPVISIWQKAYLNYRKLKNATDKIVLKYRTANQSPTELTITWTSTTTFTTTDANIANYAVGDEVEITRGKGGGMCSHITAISAPVAGVYTVTVDEVHTGATSGTATARLQKWTKIKTYVQDQTSTYKELGLPQNTINDWIQFKVFFVFTGDDQFDELFVIDKANQKAI